MSYMLRIRMSLLNKIQMKKKVKIYRVDEKDLNILGTFQIDFKTYQEIENLAMIWTTIYLMIQDLMQTLKL